MLRRGFALVSAEIEALDLPQQPLHGDAHKKNVLKTSTGLVWTDFEDACSGPIEWDLACFVRTSLEPQSPRSLVTHPSSISTASSRFSRPVTFREQHGEPSSPRASPTARNAPPSGWPLLAPVTANNALLNGTPVAHSGSCPGL